MSARALALACGCFLDVVVLSVVVLSVAVM